MSSRGLTQITKLVTLLPELSSICTALGDPSDQVPSVCICVCSHACLWDGAHLSDNFSKEAVYSALFNFQHVGDL